MGEDGCLLMGVCRISAFFSCFGGASPAQYTWRGRLEELWQVGTCCLIPTQDRELCPEELEGECLSLLLGGGW